MTPAKTLPRLLTSALLIVLLLWIALRDPQSRPDEVRLLQRESLMMGTLVSLSLYLDDGQSRAQAEAALTGVEHRLQTFEQQWSAWGDGELGQINRTLVAGKSAVIPASLRPLFAEAARATLRSEGRFDVRVGALVKLWGFDDAMHYRQQPPIATDIERLRAALAVAAPLSADHIAAADIQLDFGAIAKGYAADLAIAQFKQAGFTNAIVNLGGNLRVSGQRGDRAWSIGIRHPRPDQHSRILASLHARGDEAVLTSGDYERYFEFEGRRYHHILDPRTGVPAQGLQSVTVVATEGAWADAASTALFVAGPQHWRETAASMGITQVLVVDAQGGVTVTKALAPRLQFAEGIQPQVVP
jgi:thiamine biosynthesis lipoprotein